MSLGAPTSTGFLLPESFASLVTHNAHQEGRVSRDYPSRPAPLEGGNRLEMLWLGPTGFRLVSIYNVQRNR